MQRQTPEDTHQHLVFLLRVLPGAALAVLVLFPFKTDAVLDDLRTGEGEAPDFFRFPPRGGVMARTCNGGRSKRKVRREARSRKGIEEGKRMKNGIDLEMWSDSG